MPVNSIKQNAEKTSIENVWPSTTNKPHSSKKSSEASMSVKYSTTSICESRNSNSCRKRINSLEKNWNSTAKYKLLRLNNISSSWQELSFKHWPRICIISAPPKVFLESTTLLLLFRSRQCSKSQSRIISRQPSNRAIVGELPTKKLF